MTLRFRIEWNSQKLRTLQTVLPVRADAVMEKIANDMVTDIHDNFSRTAPNPSLPGNPPAVQTGNLKRSITARRTAQATYQIRVGMKYGKWLEYGTRKMAPRPFFRPAKARARARLPRMLKGIIK